MTDRISPERRSANMRAIRSKGMRPEMVVRSVAHRLGYRFRLHRKDLPGKPDLVFPARRAAVFVHGCFWHQHPDPACADSRAPKSNLDYWIPKLAHNVKRDAITRAVLKRQGWRVFVVWECQTKDERALQKTLRRFLG